MHRLRDFIDGRVPRTRTGAAGIRFTNTATD